MAVTMESVFENYGGEESLGDPAAMGPEERWLSLAAGALFAGYGLSKLRLRAIAALGVGAYMVYRGAVGTCPLKQRLVEKGFLPESGAGDHRGLWAAAWEGESELDQFATCDSTDQRSMRETDLVDEAAVESFPASDPPSYTGASATPSRPIM